MFKFDNFETRKQENKNDSKEINPYIEKLFKFLKDQIPRISSGNKLRNFPVNVTKIDWGDFNKTSVNKFLLMNKKAESILQNRDQQLSLGKKVPSKLPKNFPGKLVQMKKKTMNNPKAKITKSVIDNISMSKINILKNGSNDL